VEGPARAVGYHRGGDDVTCRDALAEAKAAIRFELLFSRDPDTAGRLDLLLADIERLEQESR
jgi:hypothetical protein